MKKNKICLLLVVVSVISGCAGSKKNSTDGGVTSETTGSGETEKVAPIDFSTTGSDSGAIEGLQTIYFDYDAASLTETEKNKLAGNVEWLNKNSSVKLLIEGHCDQRGSTEYNLSLGERRANAIKSLLVKMGIKANRLSTVSFGEEKLRVSGDSEPELAQNRRANFLPTK